MSHFKLGSIGGNIVSQCTHVNASFRLNSLGRIDDEAIIKNLVNH